MMAIDTRNKRSSAINPQCPWRGQWPNPDSTIDQSDRQHALWSYSGILAQTLVAPDEGIDFSLTTDFQPDFSLPQLHDFSEGDDNTGFSL